MFWKAQYHALDSRYEEGARGHRGQRHEWQGLSKVRMRGGPQLSKAVQQQLAVFLESVIEASKPESQVFTSASNLLLQLLLYNTSDGEAIAKIRQSQQCTCTRSMTSRPGSGLRRSKIAIR